jgi:hypothetical protein
MAKIKPPPPRGPVFPWGGPRSVRERLVDSSQLERPKKKSRKADPKNPALPSAALMAFIGPAHSAEEMRLPVPTQPLGHGAELTAFSDRPHLETAVGRGAEVAMLALESALHRVSATPERVAQLEALLGREQQMLELLAKLHGQMEEIQRRMREEQKETGC